MHRSRTASTLGLTLDADNVPVAIRRIVGERIAAHDAVGQMQVDVRARLEGRQVGAVRRAEFNADDAGRLGAHGLDGN